MLRIIFEKFQFFYGVGPTLPEERYFHEMIRIGRDLIVLGGYRSEHSLLRLSCSSNICKWETLSQKFEKPRDKFVAIPVPDDFVTCN